MPHYQAPDNSVHFLDDAAYEYLLPAGSVAITDEDAAGLLQVPVDPADAIKAQIAALEATVTPRRLREALLTGDHTFIDNVETQIAELRSQL